MHKSYNQIRKFKVRGKLTKYYYVRQYENGKTRWISTKKTSLQAAKALVRRWELEEAIGQSPHKKPPTLRQLFEDWKNTQAGQTSARNLKDHKRIVIDNILPELERYGCNYLHDVNLKMIEKFFRLMGTKRKWSGKTKIQHLQYLRRIFKWGMAHEYVQKNYADLFEIPKSWSKEAQSSKSRGLALTHKEATKLLKACQEEYKVTAEGVSKRRKGSKWEQTCNPPPHLYTIVLIALRTGLRRGNIFAEKAICWKHFNKKFTELKLPGALMKNGRPLHVPVHPELTNHLKNLLRKRTEALGQAPKPNDRIIQTTDSNDQNPSDIKNSFGTALKNAKLTKKTDALGREQNFRFHDLRHTFSTWLAAEVPELVKDALLGHSPSTISARYTHLKVEDLRPHLKKLPWLEEGKERKTKKSKKEKS